MHVYTYGVQFVALPFGAAAAGGGGKDEKEEIERRVGYGEFYDESVQEGRGGKGRIGKSVFVPEGYVGGGPSVCRINIIKGNSRSAAATRDGAHAPGRSVLRRRTRRRHRPRPPAGEVLRFTTDVLRYTRIRACVHTGRAHVAYVAVAAATTATAGSFADDCRECTCDR